MSLGVTLFLTSILALLFVPLALTDKRSLRMQSAYGIVGMAFALSLALLFASLGFDPHAGSSAGRVVIERVTPPVIEVDVATKWAVRGFGGWLAILAAGELLRVVLKHSAGSEILGPSIVFLAGVLLIDPQWGSGMAFAVGLVCITITTVWGKTSPPQFQRTAATESVSRASSPPDATPSS